jgi:5-methylcytosine-specific restriction endonuclease McrA
VTTGIKPIARYRQCAREGCETVYADPHDGTWPRRFCSRECSNGDATLRRKPQKVTPSKRSWTAARAKVEEEGICRACQLAFTGLQAAHIIPRTRVKPGEGENPLNIVVLCRPCHAAFDEGRLDLLPFLNRDECAYAVQLVGLHEAYRRITNTRGPEEIAA